MEHKVVVIFVTLLATAMWCAKESDSAVVRSSQEFSEALQEMLRSTVLGTVREIRSTEGEGNGTRYMCQGNPCGWAIYKKFTRQVEYFMKNTCECPDYSYKCLHAEDDLSASAYVFRCQQNSTASDTNMLPDSKLYD